MKTRLSRSVLLVGSLLLPLPALAAPPPPRGMPAINAPGAIKGLHYASLTGGKPVTPQALYGKDGRPFGAEMRQGGKGGFSVGDCFHDSTMATIAQFHPETAKAVFLEKDGSLRRSASGEPAARYFVKDPATGSFKPGKPVIYNGEFPVDKRGTSSFEQIVKGKIWAPMSDFTYTKFRDEQNGGARPQGFKRTDNGGYGNRVMEAVTGKEAKLVNFKAHDADGVWAMLKAAQEKNEIVGVGTTNNTEIKDRARDQVKAGIRAEKEPVAKFDEKKYVADHAHSAWGDKKNPFLLVGKSGERYIKVRNPWDDDPPGGHLTAEQVHDIWGNSPPEDLYKDGAGVIPFKEFLLHFSQLYIGASTPKE